MHHQGIDKAQADTGDDLNGGMTHKFLQFHFRQVFFGQILEGLGQLINDLRLLSRVGSNAFFLLKAVRYGFNSTLMAKNAVFVQFCATFPTKHTCLFC